MRVSVCESDVCVLVPVLVSFSAHVAAPTTPSGLPDLEHVNADAYKE